MAYEELDNLLTENEKTVYLALLQLGESTASPILKKTGLQNSVFYRTINRLLEKGFVSYILKGKIKHFKSNDPSIFLTQLRDKEEKIKEIIPKLKQIQKTIEIHAEAEVFLGLKGIKAMYYSLIENAKQGEEYYYFGSNEQVFEEVLEKVYLPFRKYREEKKIKVFGINKKELKGRITKFKNTQEKYTDFPLPPNMAIFRDKIVIASWGEIPTGILIRGKDIAEQYKELFNELWNNPVSVHEGRKEEDLIKEIFSYQGKDGVISYGNMQVPEDLYLKETQTLRKMRLDKGVKIRMITNKLPSQITKDPRWKKLTKIRFSKEMEKVTTWTYIFGEKVAITSLKHNLMGILIENKEFADTQRQIFENLWKQNK
jgi:sugar-specific transcriptional regulator TrmB